MKKQFFRNESHYFWVTFSSTLAIALFMTYVYPRGWAESLVALTFVDALANVIPALRNIRQYSPTYTAYWGVFYAVFWSLAPVYLVLGYLGSFFLNEYRHQKLVIDTSWMHLLSIFSIVVGCCLSILYFPFTSLGFPFGTYLNQMSSFFPKLVLSWCMTVGMFYYLGQVIGAILQKRKLNFSRSE